MERSSDQRRRIVSAAVELLTRGGEAAVSTRSVSAAAGVQAPAIYRQFADMKSLLHAASREILSTYVRHKTGRRATDDPVEELRRGWDVHVAFGLANPAAYALIYSESAREAPERHEGLALLEELVARIAEAGRLRVTVLHAARLIHAGACGVTLSLITSSPEERDPRLSHAMRDIILASVLCGPSVTAEPGPERVAARAVALQAVLGESDVLSRGERQLMGEWLHRLATGSVSMEPKTKSASGSKRRKPRASK